MPRTSRLDAPGLLQHVIIRGIEGRDIFLDDADRKRFLKRLCDLLEATETDCLAWSLLTNHAHLLLRPKKAKLSFIMRKLLTAYAVYFNLRHKRVGHLYQNRYKSVVCEEEPYLLELIRYIHLNPLRAGLVQDLKGLDKYEWSGHAVLLGERKLAGQTTDEILSRFGKRRGQAQRHYRRFVAGGIAHGHRDELVGGGMRRSKKFLGDEEVKSYDERILGSGAFVDSLRDRKELSARIPRVISLRDLITRIAGFYGIDPEILRVRSRGRILSEARAVVSYVGVREMGHNGAELARWLHLSRAGISVAATRGKEIVQNSPHLRQLIDKLTTSP